MPKASTLQVKEINAETGEEIIRDINADELAQLNADQETQSVAEAAIAQKVAEKSALLARLGITAEEAKLLLQ